MAAIESFALVVSGGPTGASNWVGVAPDDTVTNTGNWSSANSDAIMSDFNILDFPAGSTIDGIEIIVKGAGKGMASGIPRAYVFNGAWSAAMDSEMQFTKSQVTYDPGWGSAGELWGLTRTVAQALAIQITFDSSPIVSAYVDYFKVRVSYTAPSGYSHDVMGVASADISTVNGIATADISNIGGL